VGESTEMMLDIVEHAVPLLPENRPRYLMGVGKPADLVECVGRGIDMFDCVLPRAMPATACFSPAAGMCS